MSAFRKQIQEHLFFRTIVYFLLGLAIVLNPSQVLHVITYIISGYIAILGILSLVAAFQEKKKYGSYGLNLTIGIIQLVAAVAVFFFAASLLSILPIFLGILIILAGATQLSAALNSPIINKTWWLIYSILLIFAGIVLLFNPFGAVLLAFRIFGVILLIMSISELITYFQLK